MYSWYKSVLHFFYGYAGSENFYYSYVGFFYACFVLAMLPLSGESVFLFHSYIGFHRSLEREAVNHK